MALRRRCASMCRRCFSAAVVAAASVLTSRRRFRGYRSTKPIVFRATTASGDETSPKNDDRPTDRSVDRDLSSPSLSARSTRRNQRSVTKTSGCARVAVFLWLALSTTGVALELCSAAVHARRGATTVNAGTAEFSFYWRGAVLRASRRRRLVGFQPCSATCTPALMGPSRCGSWTEACLAPTALSTLARLASPIGARGALCGDECGGVWHRRLLIR
mmetsp:Transcript_11131/g.33363  ORF Transcript_11131/g.33363 Transcript_11131/m.33363 type:complete len:217 (+) Transcript_11131:63-713(+)